jgi:hypothetical protein
MRVRRLFIGLSGRRQTNQLRPRRPPVEAFFFDRGRQSLAARYYLRKNSGSLAIFAAIRRAEV